MFVYSASSSRVGTELMSRFNDVIFGNALRMFDSFNYPDNGYVLKCYY